MPRQTAVDGDLTGRTVTFSDASVGMVVAHRHPVAFVLVDPAGDGSGGVGGIDSGGECAISPNRASLDPASVPPGSTVNYLGRHVSILSDGSASRSLPRAAEIDLAAGTGVGAPDGFSLSVDATNVNAVNGNGASDAGRRPVFVPIPKISDIGLIDSPLVTGISAIDALTPIGRGQNMLVVGPEEDLEASEGGNGGGLANKRGWTMNLLRNVVEDGRRRERGTGAGGHAEGRAAKGRTTRCFYGLTSGDPNVRSAVASALDEMGVRDDVVSVVATGDSSVEQDGGEASASAAAEAVAVAAAACALGEHHALTTGGDALVVIDDINPHKALWDATTRELVRVYGSDAVVEADLRGGSSSEMRGFFSGLIQRAARFNDKNGGGSVTLILLSTLPRGDAGEDDDDAEGGGGAGEEVAFDPSDFDGMSEKIRARIELLATAGVSLTPANLNKINIPLPRPTAREDARRLAYQHVEDLISMSDGQLWFDPALAAAGRSPPLDPSRSMTRVGVGADTLACRADAPALRCVAGSLRFEFQQAADVIADKGIEGGGGGGRGGDASRQLRRRDAYLLAMRQRSDEGRRLSESCLALLAAAGGYLDDVKGGEDAVVEGLLRSCREGEDSGEVMRAVDETLELSPEGREVLERAAREYFGRT
ncbi:hypothetical protein ACHAWF_009757 [Thalassiosira exigua]